ncbi:vesicular inhibitory amino acid transporter [Nematostella vectensis]|uniref:vesicular inhibitory amino acid transporter n=1 Tax=Nematostella vectensis TaxID=45351 RepID=UPI0020774BCE|nr:vesicular inhibitory amino acid transporter [Nematostella vectensis]
MTAVKPKRLSARSEVLFSETSEDGDSRSILESGQTIRTGITEASPLLKSDLKSVYRSTRIHVWSSIKSFHQAASTTISMVEQLSLDRRASALMAGWNVTSLIQGTGTLGIPYSVRMGGWAGITTILILAWVCCFTGKLLIECLYSESKSTGKIKRVYTNYPELGGAVWPKFGNHLVSVIQVCEMFGGTIMYIVLLATLLTDLFTTCTPLRQQHWAVICTYLALPLAFVRGVSVIAWASMISVFAFTCALTTIIIYTITQYHHMSIQNIPAFDFTKFPVGFGIIVFSYTAHAVFPGVEASMRNPRMYPRMMNVAFVVAAIVKTSLGLLTVMVFGTTTQQAVTVNMKNSTVVNYLSNGFVIINVLFSFPINLFVITETLDSKFLRFFPHMDRSSEYNWAWQGLTRTLVLTLALVLVLIVPHFALFVGFVGSFTGTCLCFVLPCYFNIKLRWQSLQWYDIALRWMVIVLGACAGGLGVVFSGK